MIIRIPSEEHKELVIKLLNSSAGDEFNGKKIVAIGYYGRDKLSVIQFTFGEIDGEDIIEIEVDMSSFLSQREKWPEELVLYSNKYMKAREGLSVHPGPVKASELKV